MLTAWTNRALAPIASEALIQTAGLYQFDDEFRGRSAEERRAVRHEKPR